MFRWFLPTPGTPLFFLVCTGFIYMIMTIDACNKPRKDTLVDVNNTNPVAQQEVLD